MDASSSSRAATVDLLWIPLGTGASVVRLSGRAFEAGAALLARRRRADLYHSALVVTVDDVCTTIEMAPVERGPGRARGAVAVGSVGSPWLRRLRVFRYEVRCWPEGTIPDAPHAVGGPRRVSTDDAVARRLIAAAPRVPTPTWGRDELRCGEMWNSNSVTSWLLGSAGVDVAAIELPARGRAPGWQAGIVEVGRHHLHVR